MKLDVLKIDGTNSGESIELSDDIFAVEPNDHVIYLSVKALLANKRQGTSKAKERGEVHGGGKKPWRQKGTGRARVGSIRSPLWRKGGVVFGPKPHSFYKDLPKRMKTSALKSALNSKLRDSELVILDNLKIDSHKTREFYKVIKNLKLDKEKIRLVADNIDKNMQLGLRNIKNVNLQNSKDLNTYEALDCKKLIFVKGALKDVEERIKKGLKHE